MTAATVGAAASTAVGGVTTVIAMVLSATATAITTASTAGSSGCRLESASPASVGPHYLCAQQLVEARQHGVGVRVPVRVGGMSRRGSYASGRGCGYGYQ